MKTNILSIVKNMAEESRTRRYARKNKNQDEVIFEFTRDEGLIHQCFGTNGIYERENRLLIDDLEAFRQDEQDCNNKSYILIARQGNFCIGGARLTVSSPGKPQKLPMENYGFKLEDYFPQLKLNQISYVEVSGLVLLEEFRTGEYSKKIMMNAYIKWVALNVGVCFSGAPLVNLRSYKQSLFSLGINTTKIYYDIRVPAYIGFKDEAVEKKDYLFAVYSSELYMGMIDKEAKKMNLTSA